LKTYAGKQNTPKRLKKPSTSFLEDFPERFWLMSSNHPLSILMITSKPKLSSLYNLTSFLMQSLGASEIRILLAILEYEAISTIAFSHLRAELLCSDPSTLDKINKTKETKEDKTEDIHHPTPPNQ
jgi:hypothetical protein